MKSVQNTNFTLSKQPFQHHANQPSQDFDAADIHHSNFCTQPSLNTRLVQIPIQSRLKNKQSLHPNNKQTTKIDEKQIRDWISEDNYFGIAGLPLEALLQRREALIELAGLELQQGLLSKSAGGGQNGVVLRRGGGGAVAVGSGGGGGHIGIDRPYLEDSNPAETLTGGDWGFGNPKS